jgi:hypothetical protein
MAETVSRQYARILARIATGQCPRCLPGKLQRNPATGQYYRLCPDCRIKRNDQQRKGPREERV